MMVFKFIGGYEQPAVGLEVTTQFVPCHIVSRAVYPSTLHTVGTTLSLHLLG